MLLVIHVIQDVRRHLKAPDLPCVIGELGHGGPTDSPEMPSIRRAQAAVPARPEFKGKARFVPTQAFQRKPENSPCPGHGHHEYADANTCLPTGAALGEAMLALLPAKK